VSKPFTTRRSSPLRDLKSRGSQQQLLADFEDYLNGFSPDVQRSLHFTAGIIFSALTIAACLKLAGKWQRSGFECYGLLT
jgi:hypothetical protein